MIYHQTDAAGYYLGIVTATESPREPGVFPPPKRSYADTPPLQPEGKIARRVGNGWILEDLPDPVVTDPDVEPDPPTFEQLRTASIAELEEKRWAVEHGGFRLPDNTPIDTSARTRAFITAAYVRASKDPVYQIADFKSGPTVFQVMTNAQIIAIGEAIDDFIQACFSREGALNKLIMAATNELELDAIDIHAGWPT